MIRFLCGCCQKKRERAQHPCFWTYNSPAAPSSQKPMWPRLWHKMALSPYNFSGAGGWEGKGTKIRVMNPKLQELLGVPHYHTHTHTHSHLFPEERGGQAPSSAAMLYSEFPVPEWFSRGFLSPCVHSPMQVSTWEGSVTWFPWPQPCLSPASVQSR